MNKVYYSEIEGICSTDIFVLIDNDNVESKFYASYFLSEKFNNDVLKGLKGAQLPRVGYEYFSKIMIPYPPLATQNLIVAQIANEQTLVNAGKQLIVIFEQKIKDRIAKVWGENKNAQLMYGENDALTMAAEPLSSNEKEDVPITPSLMAKMANDLENYKPKNKKEEKLLKEMKRIVAKGGMIEIPFDF